MKQKPITPPIDSIEKDFRDALQRLQSSKPTNGLLRKKVQAGKLKVTIANVALEAGHSRTLIGMDDCKYPVTRKLIVDERIPPTGEPTTHSELIKQLRADKRDLSVLCESFKAESIRQFALRDKAEKSLQAALSRISRIQGKSGSIDNVVSLK